MLKQSVRKLYISFDPGRTTGVCLASVSFLDGRVHDLSVMESASIPWDSRFSAIKHYLRRHYYEYCIVENFRLYRTHAKSQINSEFPSSQVIGVIGYLCWEREINIHFQMAGERKRVKVDERYHEVLGGVTRNKKPKSQHRWDAFQHLRLFAVTNAKNVWKQHMKLTEQL